MAIVPESMPGSREGCMCLFAAYLTGTQMIVEASFEQGLQGRLT